MRRKLHARFQLENLEPRLMLSADLALLPIDGGALATANDPALEIALAPKEGVQATQTETRAAREIVFVDAGIEDYQSLIDDLAAQTTEGRLFEVVILDAGRDGIAQISSYLTQQQNVSAIHIVSHGSAGEVTLGSATLSQSSLERYADQLEGWQQALAADADLLFYGCDLAAGPNGQAFIDSLALLTGADVAASDDLTGNTRSGGDWVLEYTVGPIETGIAFSSQAQQNWAGTLASVTQAGSSSSAASSGAVTSLSFSHTVGSVANRLLLVSVAVANDTPVSGVSWGGTPLVFVGAQSSNSGEVRVEFWQLSAPTPGTANVIVILPVAQKLVAGASTFQGVDDVQPLSAVIGNKGNSVPSTVSVSSAPDHLVVDVAAAIRVPSSSVGADQTLLWTNQNGTGNGDVWAVSSSEAGAANVLMTEDFTAKGGGADKWAALALSISPANTLPPVITSNGGGATANISVPENTTAVTTVIATDADGNVLNYKISGGADAARFTINPTTGVLTFASAPNYEDPVEDNIYEVIVSAEDSKFSDSQTITVNVTDVNDAPYVVTPIPNQTATVGTPFSFTVAAGSFADEDAGDVLSYTAALPSGAALPLWLAFDAATSSFSGTPGIGDLGLITVRVTATDGSSASTFDDFLLSVTSINAPVANDDGSTVTPIVTAEEIPVVIDLLANDTDVDGTLNPATVVIVTPADNGSLSVDAATGAVTYTPSLNFNGSDSFTYTVNDNSGLTSNVAAVFINVTAVNDPPVANDDGSAGAPIVTAEEIPVVIDLLVNDTDVDSLIDPSTVAIVTPPAKGSLSVDPVTGVVTYSPDLNFFGTDSFTYTVRDTGGLLSNPATVFLNVTPVNDAPVAVVNTVTTAEDTPYAFSVADFIFSDVEGDALVSATLSNLSLSGGTLTHSGGTVVNPGDTLTAAQLDTLVFTPAADAFGSPLASFDFTVNDAGPGTVSATMSINVTPDNDNPAITSPATVIIQENLTNVLTVTATDIDSPVGDLRYSISGVDAVLFAINNLTGALSFNAAPDFESPGDIDSDNVYQVQVTAIDQAGGTTSQMISVTVTDLRVLDQFNGGNYTGNDGPSNWTGNWVETNDGDSSSTGVIRVVGNRLRIGGDDVSINNRSISRAVDFSTASSATLTYTYQRQLLDDTGGRVRVEISADGITWDTLREYQLNGSDTAPVSESFNIDSSLLPANLQVRFIGVGSEVESYIFFDDIQINDTASLNQAPTINSDGGLDTATLFRPENSTAVTTVVASDPQGDAPVYSISGGNDRLLFGIDMNSGVLTFNSAPDFENPADFGLDNTYEVEVTAMDNTGRVDTQLIIVNVTNVNEAPVGGFTDPNVIPVTEISQSRNGDGLVTINWKATDVELQNVSLNDFMYSDDGGANWYALASSAPLGGGWSGSWATAADFASGSIYSFTFNTQHADVAAPSLASRNIANVQVKFKVFDGSDYSDEVVSESFRVDNQAPTPLITSAHWHGGGDRLHIQGSNFYSIAPKDTDLKTHNLDWSKLVIKVYDNGVYVSDIIFTLGDIEEAMIDSDGDINIKPTVAKEAAIEATPGFGGGDDVLAITTGFFKDWFGNAATTDGTVPSPPTATNLNAVESYTEDTPLDFVNDIVVTSSGGVDVSLTLSNTAAGTLSTLPAGTATWSFDPATGRWEASGEVADVNLLLRNLVFTPTADYNSNFSIVTRVFNGFAAVGGTINMTGTPVTDIQDDSDTVAEDGSVTTNLLTNDSFVNPLRTITAVTQGANGSVAIVDAALGTVSYTPNADFNGTDSYSYTVTSGGMIETATVNVTVTQINDPATFGGDTGGSGAEDGGAITGTLTVTDTADGMSAPNFTVTGAASNGSATIEALSGAWSYTPNADFNGADSFTVSVTDEDGNVETQVISLTITPVNDLPAATANTVSTAEDTTYTFSAADFTFTDVESDALVSATLTNLNLAGGTLTHSGGIAVNSGGTLTAAQLGTLVYSPLANANGNPLASFDFAVNDADNGTTVATMSIQVKPVNDPPVVTGETLNATEDVALSFDPVTTLLGNDTDLDGDTLSMLSFGQPANGALSFDATTGKLTYMPANNYHGNDSFTYTVSDGMGGTADGVALIVVAPVADTPQVNNASTQASNLSDPIVIKANAADGPEVTHFRISGISGGTLYQADGTTPINEGDFISVTQGLAGVKFKLTTGSNAPGSFQIEASLDNISMVGGGKATSTITVVPPVEPPPVVPEVIPPEEPGPTEPEPTPPPPPVENTGTETDPETETGINPTVQILRLPQPVVEVFRPDADNFGSDNDSSATTNALKILLEPTLLGQMQKGLTTLDISTLSRETYDLIRSSLDNFKEELSKDMLFDRTLVSSAVFSSIGLSAGYVVWMLKGGSLLASVISSMPAWHLADPLSILAGRRNEDEDEESLGDIIEDGDQQDATSDEDEEDEVERV